MTEAQKKKLEQQLWNIANALRGKINADGFRDYIHGFIFYKYLSEKITIYADSILESDGIKYNQIDETTPNIEAVAKQLKALESDIKANDNEIADFCKQLSIATPF
jgi:type I restriction enzyme M protein